MKNQQHELAACRPAADRSVPAGEGSEVVAELIREGLLTETSLSARQQVEEIFTDNWSCDQEHVKETERICEEPEVHQKIKIDKVPDMEFIAEVYKRYDSFYEMQRAGKKRGMTIDLASVGNISIVHTRTIARPS